jgi:lambda family phage portal protein
MAFFDFLKRQPPQSIRIPLKARYDAATTTPDNKNHWANADALSPDAAASKSVRATLRKRARYEVANNTYARGMTLTLANDTIGTGPRLQLLTKRQNTNREIEREFFAWTQEVSLAEKLRTMRIARCQDGEGFGVLTSNLALRHPVKLDIKLIEADQVTDPSLTPVANDLDGIKLDEFGNPARYTVLTQHPGASEWDIGQEFTFIAAESMIHTFRCDRPGQHRGIPEIMPALPLFAQLRRFTLAVIAAAEAAADHALVLTTNAPPDGNTTPVDPLDEIELERRMMTVMPAGWDMGQVKAEQPVTTYAEFKHEILNEIARCLNMPFNVAAGNSSGYNYASGRLDHQTYFKSIRVDQSAIEITILDHILRTWLEEYSLARGSMRDLPVNGVLPEHQWFWDGHEHVDPAKEAKAQQVRLKSGTTTLARELAKDGEDWEVGMEQGAKEEERKIEISLRLAKHRKALMEEMDLTPEDLGESDMAPEAVAAA